MHFVTKCNRISFFRNSKGVLLHKVQSAKPATLSRLPILRKLQFSACLPLHSGLMHPVLGGRAQEHFFELSGIIIMIPEPAVHGHL